MNYQEDKEEVKKKIKEILTEKTKGENFQIRFDEQANFYINDIPLNYFDFMTKNAGDNYISKMISLSFLSNKSNLYISDDNKNKENLPPEKILNIIKSEIISGNKKENISKIIELLSPQIKKIFAETVTDIYWDFFKRTKFNTDDFVEEIFKESDDNKYLANNLNAIMLNRMLKLNDSELLKVIGIYLRSVIPDMIKNEELSLKNLGVEMCLEHSSLSLLNIVYENISQKYEVGNLYVAVVFKLIEKYNGENPDNTLPVNDTVLSHLKNSNFLIHFTKHASICRSDLSLLNFLKNDLIVFPAKDINNFLSAEVIQNFDTLNDVIEIEGDSLKISVEYLRYTNINSFRLFTCLSELKKTKMFNISYLDFDDKEIILKKNNENNSKLTKNIIVSPVIEVGNKRTQEMLFKIYDDFVEILDRTYKYAVSRYGYLSEGDVEEYKYREGERYQKYSRSSAKKDIKELKKMERFIGLSNKLQDKEEHINRKKI